MWELLEEERLRGLPSLVHCTPDDSAVLVQVVLSSSAHAHEQGHVQNSDVISRALAEREYSTEGRHVGKGVSKLLSLRLRH